VCGILGNCAGGERRLGEVFAAEGFGVGEVGGQVVDAVLAHRDEELFERFDVFEGVGFLFHGDSALAALAARDWMISAQWDSKSRT